MNLPDGILGIEGLYRMFAKIDQIVIRENRRAGRPFATVAGWAFCSLAFFGLFYDLSPALAQNTQENIVIGAEVVNAVGDLMFEVIGFLTGIASLLVVIFTMFAAHRIAKQLMS